MKIHPYALALALTFTLGCKTKEQSACLRLAELCGSKGGSLEDLDKCTQTVSTWESTVGPESAKKGYQCVSEAKSCGEATGCVAGATVKGLTHTAKDFFDGLQKGAK